MSRCVSVFGLLSALFFISCSSPYLFISDPVFAELEKSEIQQNLSSSIVFETFIQTPSIEQVLDLADKKRAGALIFSPLYHDLASRIARDGAEIPVYAVVPSGYKGGGPGLRTMELDSRGAADPFLELLTRYLPAETPVSVTLASFSEDSLWTGLTQELEQTGDRVKLKSIIVTAETIKNRGIDQQISPDTDVILILLGDYTPETVKNIGFDLPKSLPKLVVGDRFIDSDGNFRTCTIAIDWSVVYKALINGTEGQNPWYIVPESRED